jgi:hypothetical protein
VRAHPELLRFFENLPQTSAFLRQGEKLAGGLFGSTPAALGRTSFALARVVGHVGPAVTHMHYIHGDDLVRAAVVEREAGSLDKSVWMQLTGLARSTTFALLKGGGFHALMEHARRAAGWRSNAVALLGSGPAAVLDEGTRQAHAGQAAAPNTPDTAPRHAASAAATIGTSLPEWIAVSRVCEISAVVATGKRTAEQAGALFGPEPQRIETLMESLQRWLPEVAQPGKRASDDAEKGLVVLSLSSETSMSIQRAEAAARALAMRDPMALRSDLEFLIRCYDRRDRDFHVRDSASLQRLVRVALALGMTPASTMLMVRSVDPSKAEPRLPSWVRTDELGSFHACQTRCVGVRSVAKADSYGKWLGLVPVTSSLEGCGNAFAGLAALAIAILDAIAAPSAA